jgi:hypothetical protein
MPALISRKELGIVRIFYNNVGERHRFFPRSQAVLNFFGNILDSSRDKRVSGSFQELKSSGKGF